VTATAAVAVSGQKPVINRFTASPATIPAGQRTTLSWSVAGAAAIDIDNGTGLVDSNQAFLFSPSRTTTYTLTASNAFGVSTASVTVTVTAALPRIDRFNANPATVSPGQATTLSWQAPAATSFSISPGIGAVAGTSVSVSPTAYTVYTLTASNESGTTTASVPVSMAGELPTIRSFTAPARVSLGSSCTLSWSVSGATSLSLSPGIGALEPTCNGITMQTPASDTTFVLAAGNDVGSVTASATVQVFQLPPSISSFSGPYSVLKEGDSAQLTWSVWGADTISIDPGPGLVTGNSLGIQPTSTTTYTLTAANAAGTSTAAFTVTVVPPKPVIRAFGASPATIAGGQNGLLAWTVDGTAALTIDQGVGPVTGSSVTVAPATSTTYTLTATNSGGSSTATATVLVSGSLPTITSFTANPATAAVGQGTTLSWVASGATGFSIDQGVGAVTGSSAVVTPTAATTYTLSATNQFGTSTATCAVGWGWGIFSATSGPTMGVAAVALPGGKVFLASGDGSARLFDPDTGTCTPTGNMNATRGSGFTATLLPNGLVLCAGGGDHLNALGSAELFDPATGTFSPTGTLVTRRTGHTATLLDNGLVLMAGGAFYRMPNAELYDPATGTFSPTASMADNRDGHCATLLPNGKVLVTGGLSLEDEAPSGTVEIYDPANGIFYPVRPMAIRRAMHTSTLLPSGLVLVAGGKQGLSSGVNNAQLFDPATESFSATIGMTAWRISSVASPLQDGRVLVTGGFKGGWEPMQATAELFDPATGMFTQTGSMTTNRAVYTSTLLPDGRVLVTGGSSADLFDPQYPPPGP
jgi:hypothetical protein